METKAILNNILSACLMEWRKGFFVLREGGKKVSSLLVKVTQRLFRSFG